MSELPDPVAQDRILQRFVVAGRIVSMPAKESKRLVVLDHCAQAFEPGVRYPEREVNEILGGFHDDVAMLRRYLVDYGLLARDSGVYWRTGGTVDV